MSIHPFRAGICCDKCVAEGMHEVRGETVFVGATMSGALERLRQEVRDHWWRMTPDGLVDCGLHGGGLKQPDPDGTAALLELLRP